MVASSTHLSPERDGRSGEKSQSLGGGVVGERGHNNAPDEGRGGAILPTQAACSLFGASVFGNRWHTGGDGNG